jgi:hypothetical protein
MDPFAPLKMIAMAWAWWTRRIGVKWVIVLTGAATLAVAILGCRETYG